MGVCSLHMYNIDVSSVECAQLNIAELIFAFLPSLLSSTYGNIPPAPPPPPLSPPPFPPPSSAQSGSSNYRRVPLQHH